MKPTRKRLKEKYTYKELVFSTNEFQQSLILGLKMPINGITIEKKTIVNVYDATTGVKIKQIITTENTKPLTIILSNNAKLARHEN